MDQSYDSQKRLNTPQYKHAINASHQFIKEFTALPVSASDFFVKLDFQDFFMSGEAEQLAADVALEEDPGCIRDTLKEAVFSSIGLPMHEG